MHIISSKITIYLGILVSLSKYFIAATDLEGIKTRLTSRRRLLLPS